MIFFKKIFHRKREKKNEPQPKQLRIDGIKTTLTPAPDDAELAAQALLETTAVPADSRFNDKPVKRLNEKKESTPHDTAYYRSLGEKIRASKAAERRLTMRYLAYCEQQLESPLFTGSLDEIERELYKRQDIAERERGELLKRWQHCLAEVIVRQMSATELTEMTDSAEAPEKPPQ